MTTCPNCGSQLPDTEPAREWTGLGVELPPTITEIIDSIGYGG